MSLLVAALAVWLLTIPAVAVRGRVSPRVRTWTSTTSIVSGLLVLAVSLLLSAAAPFVSIHERANPAQLAHLAPGGPLAWSIGLALAGLTATRLARTIRRTRHLRRDAAVPSWAASRWFNHRGIEVRCIPTATPLAFAVPGRDAHIVVSEGLLFRLTEHQVNGP